MTQVQLPSYPAFEVIDDPTVAVKWEDWLDGFEAMLTAMKVDKKDKKAMLLHYAGADVRKLLKKLPDAQTSEGDAYQKARQALNDYFAPKMNRVYLMNMVQQVKQKPNESVDSVHMRVKEKMTQLDLESMTKKDITELVVLSQLVNYCTNTTLRKKALKDGLKLQEFPRAFERADQQVKEIEEATGPVKTDVNAVRSRHKNRPHNQNGWRGPSKSCNHPKSPRYRTPSRGAGTRKDQKTCYKCGGVYPHRGHCPAKDAECDYCHKIGHFSTGCRHRQQRANSPVQAVTQQSDDEYYVIPCINIASVQKSDHKYTAIKMDNIAEFSCVIDTGAEVNVISESTYMKIQKTLHKKILPPTQHLYAYGPEGSRTPLPVTGHIEGLATSEVTQKTVKTEFHILKGRAQNLLGRSTATDLHLVCFAETNTIKKSSSAIEELVREYADRFEGIGKMKDVQVQLHINKEVPPVQQKTRRVPFHIRDEVSKELDRLKHLDIIEPATGPTPWISPIVVVHKPQGQGIRICIDSRAMNTAIERECHPIPTIDELITDLNGATTFSKIDLNKGYHQLELHPESRGITTFSTNEGLFRYKRLSFGINSAAEIFQQRIAEMLHNLAGVRNYSDDIIVYGRLKKSMINDYALFFRGFVSITSQSARTSAISASLRLLSLVTSSQPKVCQLIQRSCLQS